MSKKGKTHAKPAADDRDAAGAGAADAAAAADAGQAPEPVSDPAPAGGGTHPTDAANAGQVQGEADAAPNAPDAGADEGEAAAALIDGARCHTGILEVFLQGDRHFVLGVGEIPALHDKPAEALAKVEVSGDGMRILWQSLPGYEEHGLSLDLADLRRMWQTQHPDQGPLFPELAWPEPAEPADGPMDASRADADAREANDEASQEITDVNSRAAFGAAGILNGTTKFGRTREGLALDADFACAPGAEIQPLIDAAAAYLRANPTAPAESVPIELKLRGHRDVPQSGLREMAAWRVFAFTLRELDRVDAEKKRLAAQAASEASPRRPTADPRDLAMMPTDPAFAPTGFSPRR